ncbi:hypothetical protein QZH41_004451 [Actinostola sp. cb2023]|nr:hypothetical protein QZH41_004451 [Actinostola sp. cb2023]
MDGWTDGRMDGWTDGRMDGWTDGRMDGWTDGRMDGWTDGRMDGWTDGRMDGWTDGRMDGWMEGCSELIRGTAVDCGSLDVPRNGSSFGNKTFFPNSIMFKCDEGFQLLGSSMRTCLSNGQWNGNRTICQAVDCGSLGVPQNGSLQGSLTVFPNVIKFNCDEGFLLRGSSSRVCQANRTWSGTLTHCEAVDCGSLDVPRNGSSFGNKTFFPNSIVFKCDEGFQLLGSSMRTCLSNGQWNGNRTICQAVDCGSLGVPQNGSLQGSLTVFPNVIKFSCDEGFLLCGSSSRVCQANRTWSGTLTHCEAVDCGSLDVPRNGSSFGNKTFFPNSIMFKCDEGFQLLGSSMRTCLSNGQWNGNRTICQAVDCGSLGVPQNGSLQGSLTVFPNVIKFNCDEGFLLRGSSSRVCQANRTWSGTLTHCEAIDCGSLSVPMNGSMYGDKTFFPNSLKFSCDEGFDLIGSSLRVCTSSGIWNGNQTTCRAIDCGPLKVPMNGSMVGNLTVFPNEIHFNCDEGFNLLGSPVRLCLSNGSWNGVQTTCKAVDCGSLAAPQNGSLRGSLTVFPNVIKFSCNEGFLLRGSSSRVCQSNRTWDGTLTRCEAIDCGPLSVPMNGSMYGGLTVYPNSLKFRCDEGFDLLESRLRKCLSSGKWSGKKTICKAIDCGSLAVPINGSRHGKLTVFPNIMKFKCGDGFDLIGSAARRCQSNGLWSGTATTCQAVDCGHLSAPLNANAQIDGITFTEKAYYTCDNGYRLKGNSVRVCQAKELGVELNLDVMVRRKQNYSMRCSTPSTPPNAYMTSRVKKHYDNYDVIYFSCRPGYFLRGGRPAVSCIDGKWNKAVFSCAVPRCKPPQVPVNAYITYPRGQRGPYVANDEVFFSCKSGYYLSGNPSIQCKDDWTAIKFKCYPTTIIISIIIIFLIFLI